MRTSEGACRRSSVCGLKESPQMAMVFLSGCRCSSCTVLEEDVFLCFVYAVYGLYKVQGVARFPACLNECFYVFREATASVSGSGVEEFLSNAAVGPDAHAHAVYIGTYAFAQVGDLVHERDACSQHGICGVFCHLGRGDVHEEDPEILEQERAVEVFHELLGPFGFYAYHYAVGAHEVADGVSFFEKLGVGGDIEGNLGFSFVQFAGNHLLYFGCRSYGDGAFGGEQQVAGHVLTYGACYVQYVAYVCAAVFFRWCAYGAEYNLGMLQAGGDICCEVQPVCRTFRWIMGSNPGS